MLLRPALTIAIYTATAVAVAVPASYAIHESRDVVPWRWIKRDRLRPDSILPVRIGLAQSNVDEAEDDLMAVSNPDSPVYGKYWTAQQVIEAFKPNDETIQTVKTWLRDAGIKNAVLTENKAWFAFNARASEIESLLQTEYHEYQDLYARGIMPSCDRYHVPNYVQKHIDYITPGIKLLAPSSRPQEALRKREPLGNSGSQGLFDGR